MGEGLGGGEMMDKAQEVERDTARGLVGDTAPEMVGDTARSRCMSISKGFNTFWIAIPTCICLRHLWTGLGSCLLIWGRARRYYTRLKIGRGKSGVLKEKTSGTKYTAPSQGK